MAFGALLGTLTGTGLSITNPSDAAGSVAVSVGDLIIAVIAEQLALTATAVTDNLGNSYTAQNAGVDSGTGTGIMFYSRVTVAGTLTVLHFAATASSDNYVVIGAAYTGPFSAPPIDANPANVSDILTPYLGPATGTLAQASELVISWVALGNTAPGDWTTSNMTRDIITVDGGGKVSAAIASLVVSATTSIVPSWTGTAPPDDTIGTASFMASAAADVLLGTRLLFM